MSQSCNPMNRTRASFNFNSESRQEALHSRFFLSGFQGMSHEGGWGAVSGGVSVQSNLSFKGGGNGA
jgi:hypothetical protein